MFFSSLSIICFVPESIGGHILDSLNTLRSGVYVRVVSQGELSKEVLGEVGIGRPVIVLGMDIEFVRPVLRLSGCVPVVLSAEIGQPLSRGEWLEFPDFNSVRVLFSMEGRCFLSLLCLERAVIEAEQYKIKERFLSALDLSSGIYIFGVGSIGLQVQRVCAQAGLSVRGFVDNDKDRHGLSVNGVVVYSVEQLDPKTDVVLIGVGNHASTIRSQLEGLSFIHLFNLSEFFFSLGVASEPEVDYIDDFFQNRIEWISLFLKLSDHKSRRVMTGILLHRVSLDTRFLEQVRSEPTDQWFDPEFFVSDNAAVFVDGGGFDGDTALLFRERNGPCENIYVFEPDALLAKRAKVRLLNVPEALVFPAGLYSRSCKVAFAGANGTAGRIDHTSLADSALSEMVDLDSTITRQITFLKLDVEGAEDQVLQGAKLRISGDHPTIAMAVYHKAKDPWFLANEVLAINNRYQLFLRHYTEVAFETVVYAIPS